MEDGQFLVILIIVVGIILIGNYMFLRPPEVDFLTGTVSSGGNIPLPDGYEENECQWMVAAGEASWAPGNPTHYGGHKAWTVGRQAFVQNYDLGLYKDIGARSVNYIVICAK